MPISTVIVDDEQLARDELAFLLRDFSDVQIVAQGSNGIEAVKLVAEHQPDLLVLDVQMPGIDGFAVLKKLLERKLRLPQVIFATAYDQYAVQAFEVNAVDYLLKPFDTSRLSQALDKVRRQLHTADNSADKIDRVLQLLERRGSPPPAKTIIRANGRHYLLDQREIIYARIEDGVITVTTTQLEGHSTYRTIEELQASLDTNMFWRAHRSYLVNLNRIKEVVPWFNSSYQLRMDDKKHAEIPVSRTQSRRLRELFNL